MESNNVLPASTSTIASFYYASKLNKEKRVRFMTVTEYFDENVSNRSQYSAHEPQQKVLKSILKKNVKLNQEIGDLLLKKKKWVNLLRQLDQKKSKSSSKQSETRKKKFYSKERNTNNQEKKAQNMDTKNINKSSTNLSVNISQKSDDVGKMIEDKVININEKNIDQISSASDSEFIEIIEIIGSSSKNTSEVSDLSVKSLKKITKLVDNSIIQSDTSVQDNTRFDIFFLYI